jgi:hypothetical protein
MDRSDYETEVQDELKDNGTYKEIKEDLTTNIENKLRKMSQVCVTEMGLQTKCKDFSYRKVNSQERYNPIPKFIKQTAR